MNLRLLVASSVLLACLGLAPPTATANHTCATASFVGHNSVTLGTVGDPALGYPSSAWYLHFGGGTDVYTLAVGAGGSTLNPEVQITFPTAILNIWDSTCTVLLCSVFATVLDPAVCVFGGPARVQVLYSGSHDYHTHYTLSVAT